MCGAGYADLADRVWPVGRSLVTCFTQTVADVQWRSQDFRIVTLQNRQMSSVLSHWGPGERRRSPSCQILCVNLTSI